LSVGRTDIDVLLLARAQARSAECALWGCDRATWVHRLGPRTRFMPYVGSMHGCELLTDELKGCEIERFSSSQLLLRFVKAG